MRERWIACGMTMMLGGCGADADAARADEARALCVMFALHYANACERCEGPDAWTICYEAQKGNCATTRAVRDADALTGVCLPWLASAPCNEFPASDASAWSACARQFGGGPW